MTKLEKLYEELNKLESQWSFTSKEEIKQVEDRIKELIEIIEQLEIEEMDNY